MSPGASRRRIAVIGAGVSGLTAAWALHRDADITLFEADDRLGGHAHTHDVPDARGLPMPVDSGFLVHNARTYPTLLRLFAELGVATQPAQMSLSVRCDGCGLEYAGARGLRGLLPRARNLSSPAYLRMLREIPRFHRVARAELAKADPSTTPLGQIVRDAGFSPYFGAHFLTPLIASVWSCSPETAMLYPARYLFEFLDNHGMLSVTGSPPWMTVTGGSRTYVERIAKQLPAVRTTTPVRSVARRDTGVEIVADGAPEWFDAAVVACHADQALALLAQPSADQRAVLGAFRYSRNETLLHTDERVLPVRPAARASWNYRLPACQDQPSSVLVSYDVTRLQTLPASKGGPRYLVTLNDDGRVDPAKVVRRMLYEHPVYTPDSVAAQARLESIEDGVIAFAGAYHGWGFHEDGAASGLRAARRLGATW